MATPAGVYAWIGINFVLGRFDHAEEGSQGQPISRQRTVGIMDMGGASLQIAYEVPGTIAFGSPQEVKTLAAGEEAEEAAASVRLTWQAVSGGGR